MDALEIIRCLLAFGAQPESIPKHLWHDYMTKPCDGAMSRPIGVPEARWCTVTYSQALQQNMNLSQRYFLHKASRIPRPSPAISQFARTQDIVGILKAPYHIIAQERANNQLRSIILTSYSLRLAQPIVPAFAGPSGHGKTELTKRLGDLLSLPCLRVDCSEVRHETNLFGPKAPYEEHEKGSPLNNHLLQESGKEKHCVSRRVRKVVSWGLKRIAYRMWWRYCAFDNVGSANADNAGLFRDYRTHIQIDCSRTIWILATNLVDSFVIEFHDRVLQGKSPSANGAVTRADYADLERSIRDTFKHRLGVSKSIRTVAKYWFIQQNEFSGRVKSVIPFFPFSTSEAAVLAHSFLLRIIDRIKRPIDGKTLQMGRVWLSIRDHGPLCEHVARCSYDKCTGARPVKSSVEIEVEEIISSKYLDGDAIDAQESNECPLKQYRQDLHCFGDGKCGREFITLEDMK